MKRRFSIAEARQQFAAIVHELDGETPVEITRRGEPVAVLLSRTAYERLVRGSMGFWAAYEAYRATYEHSYVTEDNPFEHIRDTSPGRPVDL